MDCKRVDLGLLSKGLPCLVSKLVIITKIRTDFCFILTSKRKTLRTWCWLQEGWWLRRDQRGENILYETCALCTQCVYMQWVLSLWALEMQTWIYTPFKHCVALCTLYSMCTGRVPLVCVHWKYTQLEMYTIGLCGLLSTDVGTVGRSGVFILCYIVHRVHTQFSVCTGNTTCIILSVHTR